MAAITIASLQIAVSAPTQQASSSLIQLHTQLGNLNSHASSSMGGVSSAVVAMGTIIGNVVTSAINNLTSLASSALETGVSFLRMKEQASIAFTNLLGSTEKAKGFMKDLADFANKTPFEFGELTKAAQKFTAMGFQAKEVIPILTSVGNAVAAMGGNAQMVDRVTVALVQLKAKGKVSAQEMMQLAEAGIPAWQILAEKIGVSIPEAMKRGEKGAISASFAIKALTEGMDARFGGMMEKQSHTFSGLMSTISDTSQQVLGSVLEPLFRASTGAMQIFVDLLPDMQKGIEGLSDQTKLAAVAFTGLALAAGAAATAIALTIGGPAALAVGALGAATAITAAAFITNFANIRSMITAWTGSTQVSFRSVVGYIGAGADAFNILVRSVLQGVDLTGTALRVMAQAFKDIVVGIQGFGTSVKGIITFDPTTIMTGVAQMKGAFVDFDKNVSTQLRAFGMRTSTNFKEIGASWNHQYQDGLVSMYDKTASTLSKAGAKFGEFVDRVQSIGQKANKNTEDAMGAKGAKKGKDETEKILKEQLDSVNDWLKGTQHALSLNNKVWKMLPQDVSQVLLETSAAFHRSINDTQMWAASLQAAFLKAAKDAGDVTKSLVVAVKGTKIEITSAQVGVKSVKSIDINPNLLSGLHFLKDFGVKGAAKALDEIALKAKQMGATFNLTIPKIDQDFSILQGTIAGTAIVSKAANEQMGAGIEAWADRTKRALQGVKGQLTWSDLFSGILVAPPKPFDPEKFGLGKDMAEAVAKMKNDIQSSLGDGVGGILVGLAGKFNWHLDKVRSWASDMGGIIDTVPGKFGDMARDVYSTIDQWVSFADKVLSIIGRMTGQAELSVGGLISKIISQFKNAGSASGGAGGSGGGLLGAVGGFFGKLFGGGGGAGVGAMGTGISEGMASNAAGGASWLGALGGPWGMAAMAGAAALPAIIGLFKKKSAAEKEAEANQRENARLQLEQSKLAIQETRQTLMKGAIEIGQLFTEFADQLSDYSGIPKDAFRAFNKDLLKYAEGFGETATAISPEIAKNIKELGESLQPALESGNLFLELAEGLNKYTGIAKTSIKRAGADMEVLITELADVYENLTKQQIKLARKLGEKTKEPIALVKDYLAATLDFGNIRVLTAQGIEDLKSGIDSLVKAVTDIATKTDLGLTKQGARFAERAITFTNLIKSAREAFSGDFVFSGSSIASAMALLYDGIQIAAEKTGQIARALGEDILLETSSAAEHLSKIVSIWKEAAEGFNAILAVKDDPTLALDILYAAILTATEKTALIAITIGQDLLNQAKDAAVAIKEVVGVLKDSGEGFQSLFDFYTSTKDFDFEAGATRLQGGIFILLDKLISLSRVIPTSMLNEASSFAAGMKPVFETFNAIFASFKELISAPQSLSEALSAIQSALENAITRARGLTDTATGFLNQSANFKNIMREAADNFRQGMSFQASAKSEDKLVSSAGSQQQLLRSQSGGPTSIVYNSETQINISAGAFVVDITKFKDVEEFMAEMRRRWSSSGLQQSSQTL
jgi:tape measure domain-containing protein